jgi:hypothetical protein
LRWAGVLVPGWGGRRPAAGSAPADTGNIGAKVLLFGLVTVWLALFVAYYSPYPIGFWLTSIGFAGYVAAVAGTTLRQRYRRPAARPVLVAG